MLGVRLGKEAYTEDSVEVEKKDHHLLCQLYMEPGTGVSSQGLDQAHVQQLWNR